MITDGYLTITVSLITALLVAYGAVRLRGTTLVAPALWALGAVLSLAAVELLRLAGAVEAAYASPIRYAASVTTLCPMVAILGAKRPQDRAWQWVVVALLATLWLPAARWSWLDGGPEKLALAWQFFLLVLASLGPLNYLPTRNWLAAVLVFAGQGVLIWPYLSAADRSGSHWGTSPATSLFLLAAGSVWLHSRSSRNSAEGRSGRTVDPLRDLDHAWIRFRDAFGAFWAVRVMQRVNQGLGLAAPQMTLTWQGWSTVADAEEEPGEQRHDAISRANRALRTALRRFVRID